MNLEIERQINSETKEVWYFNIFDLNIVFIAWHRETKPKGKRKWTIENFWDKYSHKHHIKMVQEPELPEDIKEEVIKKIKVLTWDEWKSKK